MELPGEVQNLCRATTESSLRGSKWPNIEVQSRLIRGDLKVIKCGFLLHLVVTGIHSIVQCLTSAKHGVLRTRLGPFVSEFIK